VSIFFAEATGKTGYVVDVEKTAASLDIKVETYLRRILTHPVFNTDQTLESNLMRYIKSLGE
jgi:ribosomal protein L21E